MADKLHFSLVSPERELLGEEVDMVEVPGTEGIFCVLPDHAPFMSTLASGVVKVTNGSDEKRIFVAGGFAEVTPAGLTILAEEAMPVAELDKEAIAKRITLAEERAADTDLDAEAQLFAAQEVANLKELQA